MLDAESSHSIAFHRTEKPQIGADFIARSQIQSTTTWAQEAYIKASNTDANDGLGRVALSGDTLVLGAFRESSAATGINGNQADNSAPSSGAVYIFE